MYRCMCMYDAMCVGYERIFDCDEFWHCGIMIKVNDNVYTFMVSAVYA